MQRKLTSEQLTVALRMRSSVGMPEMNATSRRDFVARTPTCHSLRHPGAFRALSLSIYGFSVVAKSKQTNLGTSLSS